MGEIAERFVNEWMQRENSSPPREAELAVYAVQELRKRLTEFMARYYGAWGPEGRREAPAPIGQKAQPAADRRARKAAEAMKGLLRTPE
jgi:hypothetical protein